MEALLKLTNICKYYHSENNVSLGLNKINLSFSSGEFVAITGESGSGKSTLLNVIAGLDSYEDGELYYKGSETSHFDKSDWEDYRKNNISFIFQNYNLIDSYTALENVMSVLFIQGYQQKEAKEKALRLLEKVGLSERAKNRATQLSSGQKQRLAIARALAKDTDIIVADEPTGNLDAENGKAIIEILSELSKDKLVLLVTHNYEQAEPYVTRKIRLADGVVKADNQVNERKEENEKSEGSLPVVKQGVKNKIETAALFSRLNIKNQPKRVIAILSLVAFTTFCNLSCLYIFESNKNIENAKEVVTDSFLNVDKTRLAVVKSDVSDFTTNEIATIKNLSNKINEVDYYGVANDFNYYITPEDDYTLSTTTNSAGEEVSTKVIFNDNVEKFVRSTTCLNESDLSAGTIPTNGHGIVLYSRDKSLIGTKKTVYITNYHKWNLSNSTIDNFGVECTITGLLKEKTEQVYFSEDICYSLACSINSYRTVFSYTFTNKSTNLDTVNSYASVALLINSELSGNQARLSKYLTKFLFEGNVELNPTLNPSKIKITKSQEALTDEYEIDIVHQSHWGSNRIVEVSPELFNQIYQGYAKNQISVFMKDYAYTNSVLNVLSWNSFRAISVYRVCSIDWNVDKIVTHYATLAISLLLFVVISILEVVISKALLKFKKNDFIILRSLGMGDNTVHLCNYIELVFYALIGIVLSYVLMVVLGVCGVKFFVTLYKYISLGNVVFFTIYTLLLTLFMGLVFNRFLTKQMARVTSLKEGI